VTTEYESIKNGNVLFPSWESSFILKWVERLGNPDFSPSPDAQAGRMVGFPRATRTFPRGKSSFIIGIKNGY
jgi:hypothetical protein